MSDKPAKRFASFAIAIPLYRIFDYAIEPGKSGAAGSRYRLPFGPGYKTGLLLDKHDSTSVPGERIKSAGECLDD